LASKFFQLQTSIILLYALFISFEKYKLSEKEILIFIIKKFQKYKKSEISRIKGPLRFLKKIFIYQFFF